MKLGFAIALLAVFPLVAPTLLRGQAYPPICGIGIVVTADTGGGAPLTPQAAHMEALVPDHLLVSEVLPGGTAMGGA